MLTVDVHVPYTLTNLSTKNICEWS